GTIRQGDHGHGSRGGRVGRHHGGRRRRVGGSGEPIRLRRSHQPYFDRWRGITGVHFGRGTAGGGGVANIGCEVSRLRSLGVLRPHHETPRLRDPETTKPCLKKSKSNSLCKIAANCSESFKKSEGSGSTPKRSKTT